MEIVENEDWIKSATLGNPKEFLWKLSNDNHLHIKRKFGERKALNSKEINVEQLNQINVYVEKNDWTDLSNSVSKLFDGTEKEGLGKFLYDELGWSTTDAQLASQLGAIFTLAGVWLYN